AGALRRLVPRKGACRNGETYHAQPYCFGRSVNRGLSRPAVARGAGFFVSWTILSAGNPADLGAGAVAIFAATWTSLRLLPPGTSRVRPLALAQFALRFLHQSLIAG